VTPDELQRVLDNRDHKQSGGGALYAVALAVIALIVFLVYGGL